MEISLKLSGVSKSYAGTQAVRTMDFALLKGRVHALVGENGAGKSTLVKIISGGIASDTGSLEFETAPYRPTSPADAQRLGVVAVQQELSLSPYLPVYQNLWLCRKDGRNRFFVDKTELKRKSAELCQRYGVSVNIHKWVSELSLEEQQIVEILKALALEPKVIILDEPTSSLGAANTAWLIRVIKELKARGRAVMFISHRMAEVLELSDDITVLKDGQKIATVERTDVGEDEIVKMMVGRALADIFPPKADLAALEKTPPLIEAKNLRAEGVHEASFTIRPGEIVGLAGLEGQGQHELMMSVFGLKPAFGGTIELDGKAVSLRSPAQAIEKRIALVPVDRRTEGVVLPLSVAQNIALATLPRRQKWGWIDSRREESVVKDMVGSLSIKSAGSGAAVQTLSGGNQQKVALGKWLASDPRVLLLDDPTRGVDIQTRQEIYYKIRGLASQGKAIMLNSTDVMELVGLCDRVLVMYEGRVVSTLVGNDITEERIVGAAVGVKERKQ